MPRFLNRRLAGLGLSEIRLMTVEAERAGAINLGQGLCPLPTPDFAREAAARALRDGRNQYSLAAGVPQLRRALADKLARDNEIAADPDTEIVVTAGSAGGFAAALMALLEPGDGLLLLEPYYGYYVDMARALGLEPEFLPLAPPDFRLDEEALAAAVTPRTRALVLCTPCNPSGKMLTADELAAVAAVADARDLLVISDEIYEYFVYDGRRHRSAAARPDLRARTVTLMGPSKTFSCTGWRLGYAIAPPDWARALTLVHDLLVICAPTPLQYGALAALHAPPEYYADLRRRFQHKRDRLCAALAAAGLPPIVPEGAYYVLADARALPGARGWDRAMALLAGAGVAAVPGTAFYQDPVGETLLRFSFAVEDEVLDEACRRLRAFGA